MSLDAGKSKINSNRHDRFFAEQLLELFGQEPYFITDDFKRSFLRDASCLATSPFLSERISKKASLIEKLKISENYFYTIYIDKARIDYCRVKGRQELELQFKDVVVLRDEPTIESVSNPEKIKLNGFFEVLRKKNVK